MGSVVERFNAIRWHDSKFLAIRIYRSAEGEEVRIETKLWNERRELVPTTVAFKEPTYVKAEIDLEGKRFCSDDIADGECKESSDWIKELIAQNPYDSFEGYLHFGIWLISPGGTIDILAKDFVLEVHEV